MKPENQDSIQRICMLYTNHRLVEQMLIILSQSQSKYSVNFNSDLLMNYVDILSSGKGGDICK